MKKAGRKRRSISAGWRKRALAAKRKVGLTNADIGGMVDASASAIQAVVSGTITSSGLVDDVSRVLGIAPPGCRKVSAPPPAAKSAPPPPPELPAKADGFEGLPRVTVGLIERERGVFTVTGRDFFQAVQLQLERANRTRADLAREVGCHTGNLSRLLNGQTRRSTLIGAICRVLRIDQRRDSPQLSLVMGGKAQERPEPPPPPPVAKADSGRLERITAALRVAMADAWGE